jgi:hypothetical protein
VLYFFSFNAREVKAEDGSHPLRHLHFLLIPDTHFHLAARSKWRR